jgi:uncharacterized protein (DUF433 family)
MESKFPLLLFAVFLAVACEWLSSVASEASIARLAEDAPMTAKTFQRIFGYTDTVLRNKPIRQSGQDLRDFPTYTIPEVATFLGVSRFTLWDWFSGSDPILKPSGSFSGMPLLSFRDTVEAYAIYMLRVHHKLSMQSIRRNIANLPQFTRAKRPLVSENLKVLEKRLLLERARRGRFGRHHIDLDGGQLVINEVADIFGNRVITNPSGRITTIYPWRFWQKDRESKPVEIDAEIMSGRLVLTGTRIPVSVIAGRSRKESIADIASDYGLPSESVKKALMHVDKKAA